MTDFSPAAGSPDDVPQGGTAPLAGSESTGRDYVKLFWYVLLGALVLRLFLIRFPYMFTLDVNTFRSWGDTIVKVGPHNFYANTWSDYPPLFMYFLWAWGWLQKLFTHESLMSVQWAKMPGVLADCINGYLIFHLLKGRVAIRSAFRTAAFYLFNPVVVFVSAVWGQVDAVVTMMMLTTSMLVLSNRLFPSTVLSAATVLVKPQGLFMIPVVFFALWHKHPVWKWPLAILAGLTTAWLILVPATWNKLFDLSHGPLGFLQALFVAPFFWFNGQMKQTGDNYPYSTVNAFNVWMLPPPNEAWKPDDRLLFMLPHKTWGIVLVVGLLGLVGWYMWRNRHVAAGLPYFLATSVTLVGFYMLATRMHERYIFPAIAFLALAQAFNRRLTWIYWAFSFTSFISICYVFFYYNDQSAWVEGVKSMFNNGPMIGSLKLSGMVLISLVNVWLFGELLSFLFVKGDIAQDLAENRVVKTFRTIKAQVVAHAYSKADVLIPAAIAAVFMGIAFIRLGIPSEQIFDEVYHARTAMEYIKGVSPYEWTHPPLAKLIAAVGVLIWGGGWELEAKTFTAHQAFSWRFTAVIFGGLTLVATYVLTRLMFNNRVIAAAATIMLALDGVFFVQSRVAMTNIYEVFFIMLGTIGTWQLLKTDDGRWLLLTGFGLGCALATRWSSLYAWGLTGLLLLYHAWTVRRHTWVAEPSPDLRGFFRDVLAADRKGVLKYVGLIALTMGVIPVGIYFLTYLPYVLQGGGDFALKVFNWNHANHGWGRVVAWQKEMWGYHANLNATHPYSSPWWSWPLMLRPTWYYFHDWKDTPGLSGVSGVWAIGNAFIWWTSIPALLYAAYFAWRDQAKALGVAAMLGIGLWAMWGVQPRPLLYMHYMFETIPFACIALAYIGYVFWNGHAGTEPVTAAAATSGGAGAPAGEAVGPAADAVPADGPPALDMRTRRLLVLGLGSLIVLWFAFYYPLLAAIPIPWPFYNWHVWFGRAWI
jgi:Gpi18-like mannosyltransferase